MEFRDREPQRRDSGRRDRDRDREPQEFQERLVAVNRVAKVVKGGRNFRFTALMVVGDGKGRIGIGQGKAAEIPEAIRKGVEDAKKNLHTISLNGNTIPHEVKGRFGKGLVLMFPAEEGAGVIAGGSVRALLEMAGIKNIRTKSYGSNNPINAVKAAMAGLVELRSAEDVARLRGKTVEQILG